MLNKILSPGVRQIIKMGLPVVIGQIMYTLLNFADRFFISRLGLVEAAGSSLSGNIMWLLISFTAIVSGGTVALVARTLGEKNAVECKKSAEQSIWLALWLSIILSILAYLSGGSIFNFFGVEKAVEEAGLSYYNIIITGFPLMMLGSVMGAIFQASGNTKIPMLAFLGMSLLNIILDPIMIFSCNLGLQGAAWATIISEVAAVIWLAYKLKNYEEITINNILTIKPELAMIRRLLKVGVWTGLNSFSRPLSAIAMQKIIAFHGTKTIAAFSFGIQWISLVFMFMEGLRVAVSTLVGQKLGAKEISGAEDAVRDGKKAGYWLITIMCIVGFPLARPAMTLFSDDPTVIAMGSAYLYIILPSMIFQIMMTVFTAAFNGAGDSLPPTVIAFIANWPGKIGFAWLSTYYFKQGTTGLWVAIAISLVVEGLGISYWFRKGKWKHKKV